MKSNINWGLIGVGGFGKQHLIALRQLERGGEIRLSAVCDPTLHRFPDLEAELKGCNIRLYQNLDDMLSRESDLKAVTIAAPIPFHNQMAGMCLERDLFVYLEKPPVPLLKQLDQLILADAKERIGVGFQMIESDWSLQFKRWITEGKLGELQEIRIGACWPRADSYYNRATWAGRMALNDEPVFDGPATNALAHLIHNAMFFAGEDLEGFAEPLEIQGELYRARPIESYDAACLRGRFSSGSRFFAALTHATQKTLPFQVKITGTKGWARISEDERIIHSNLGVIQCEMPSDEIIVNSYRAFIGYIKGTRNRPPTLLRDARGYCLATNAMLLSSGGIHTIDESWVQQLGEKGETIHEAQQLYGAVADSLQHPLLFSERELPWAVKTQPVLTEDLSKGHFSSFDKVFHSTGTLSVKIPDPEK